LYNSTGEKLFYDSNMQTEQQRAEKIMNRINQLAAISEDTTGITRRFGTPAFVAGRDKVLYWMTAAGLETRIDNIGNVRGKWSLGNDNNKTLVIASHIDTVVNAGKFDGPLGVLMGLDLLEHIIASKTTLPFNIELVAFCDEEGVRFHTTYLGSKVLAGSFDKEILQRKDESGITLEAVIQQLHGNSTQLEQDAIPAASWLGYFEIHIEQGPVLYEKDVPVALVTGIAGQSRMEIVFEGMAGHAGTVPMHMRNDALCCAAEFILELEKFALANKELVATVGKLNIINAAGNVIPGEVVCSLDVRSANQALLTASCATIKTMCERIAHARNITVTWKPVQQTAPVACSNHFNTLLAGAIAEAGYETISLVSGAGHDAVPISAVAPVAMLFVRCFKGISHNPLENVELKDITAAIKVSDNFIRQLANDQMSR
jgi:allantoate deiminase